MSADQYGALFLLAMFAVWLIVADAFRPAVIRRAAPAAAVLVAVVLLVAAVVVAVSSPVSA